MSNDDDQHRTLQQKKEDSTTQKSKKEKVNCVGFVLWQESKTHTMSILTVTNETSIEHKTKKRWEISFTFLYDACFESQTVQKKF